MEYVFFDGSDQDAVLKSNEIRYNLIRVHNHLNAPPHWDEKELCQYQINMMDFLNECDEKTDEETIDSFLDIMVLLEGSGEAYEDAPDILWLKYLIELSSDLQQKMKKIE